MTRFLLPLLLLAASPLTAGTVKQQNGPATLEFHFPSETPGLALADLLTVTLTIEGHESMRVRAPQELAASEPWQLVERSEPDRKPIGAGRVRWQLHYRFAPREPGKKVPFAFPPIVLREKEDEDRSLQFEPIFFEVVTSIAPTDHSGLRDITAIEEVPISPVAELDWRWIVLTSCFFGLTLLAFLIRLLMKRRRPRCNAQIALYELHRLTALELPEQNRSERFVTLLTVLTRRYLERQFGLPARRQTTSEFVQQLAQNPSLSSEEKQFLNEFLQGSEAVKFANQPMSLDECRRWSEAVKHFLQHRTHA